MHSEVGCLFADGADCTCQCPCDVDPSTFSSGPDGTVASSDANRSLELRRQGVELVLGSLSPLRGACLVSVVDLGLELSNPLPILPLCSCVKSRPKVVCRRYLARPTAGEINS